MSTAVESESVGDSNSVSKFGSESEYMSSFWRFFSDMGKNASGESGNEKREINETRLV